MQEQNIALQWTTLLRYPCPFCETFKNNHEPSLKRFENTYKTFLEHLQNFETSLQLSETLLTNLSYLPGKPWNYLKHLWNLVFSTTRYSWNTLKPFFKQSWNSLEISSRKLSALNFLEKVLKPLELPRLDWIDQYVLPYVCEDIVLSCCQAQTSTSLSCSLAGLSLLYFQCFKWFNPS